MRPSNSILLIMILLIATPAASAPPPCVLICPANISASRTLDGSEPTVTYATPVALPGCMTLPFQSTGLPSGASFPIGTTTNCFHASGTYGVGTCCFTVTITSTTLEPATPVPSGRPSTWWTLAALTLLAGGLAATRWLR